MPFTHKSINPSDRIGLDLIELRERMGLSRQAAAQLSRMTESFITALEAEDWERIGDPVYAEHMLRAYIRTLGGKESYYLNKYRRCVADRQAECKKQDARLIHPLRVRLADLLVGSRILAVAGFFVFVALLGAYVYREAMSISAPPPLSVSEPSEGQRQEQPQVLVAGTTLPEAAVTINGRDAVVESDGSFRLTLDIPRGSILITVSAKKRHGRDAVVERHVIYERALPPLFGPTSTQL